MEVVRARRVGRGKRAAVNEWGRRQTYCSESAVAKACTNNTDASVQAPRYVRACMRDDHVKIAARDIRRYTLRYTHEGSRACHNIAWTLVKFCVACNCTFRTRESLLLYVVINVRYSSHEHVHTHTYVRVFARTLVYEGRFPSTRMGVLPCYRKIRLDWGYIGVGYRCR